MVSSCKLRGTVNLVGRNRHDGRHPRLIAPSAGCSMAAFKRRSAVHYLGYAIS